MNEADILDTEATTIHQYDIKCTTHTSQRFFFFLYLFTKQQVTNIDKTCTEKNT